MITRVNRILTVLFSVAVVLAVFAGCGGSSTPAAPAPDSAPAAQDGAPAEAPAAPSGETINLELWHIQMDGDFPNIIQRSVDRYMEANPQYNVEVVPTANDAYKQKLAVAMGANQMPDIYISWSGGPMIEYIKAGHMQPITSQINSSGLKDKLLDAGVAQATYSGDIWGVPVENVAAAVVYYNKAIYEELGLSVPATISELEANADAIIAAGKTPFSLANSTQWTGSMYYMYFATRHGGLQPFQDAATGEGTFESDTFVYAGDKIQEWVGKNYFNVGFNGIDEDSGQSRQLLYADQAVMHVMGSWFLSNVLGENPEFYEKIGIFPFPAVDGSSADPTAVVGTVGDNFYHVSGSCADVDGAFGVIAALLDDQAIAERTANGRIVPIKGAVVEDPLLKVIMGVVENASGTQLWYDQYLPPEVADMHKTTSQEIFGGTMTPQDANTRMQETMAAYLARS
ncbi:MAG: extracellular solute-binding protein [Oscillospiraceae bacterium]|nr:extracellular solute-binding protein [Oscillospiraceae bacterium]